MDANLIQIRAQMNQWLQTTNGIVDTLATELRQTCIDSGAIRQGEGIATIPIWDPQEVHPK